MSSGEGLADDGRRYHLAGCMQNCCAVLMIARRLVTDIMAVVMFYKEEIDMRAGTCLCIFITMSLLLGCRTIPQPKPMAERNKISCVYWIISNEPTGFYPDSKATCIFKTSIKLENKIKEDEIVDAYFMNSLGTYTLKLQNNIDFERNLIGKSGLRFRQDGDNILRAHTFLIGSTWFYVKFSDGSISEYELIIPAPGEKGNNGYDIVVTEDFKYGEKAWGEAVNYKAVKALARPIIKSYSNDANRIKISFVENDQRFYSGGITFFDENQNVIGSTSPFLDGETKKTSRIINNGDRIEKGTAENMVNIGKDDINFCPDKSFADIKSFFVCVTDGAQYGNQFSNYDYISYSERKKF
jgi:hypothetical protein